MAYVLSPEKKQMFLAAYPELATLMRLEFDSYEDFKQIADGRGVVLPQNAWQYFSPLNTPTEVDEENVIDESLKKDHSKHHTIAHPNGQQVDAKKAYQNIVENTVRDWNAAHRNNPDLQITGKVFIKRRGDRMLNPEVVQKFPQIHTHANEVFATAFGRRELQRYKQRLQNAPYKSPENDPVIQEFEKNVTAETQRRITDRENELKQNGTGATLTEQERRQIETDVRRDLFGQLAENNQQKIEAYTKRRFLRKIPWLKKTYKTYKQDLKRQYQTQTGFEKRVATRADHIAQTEISRLKAIDRVNNIKRDNAWYERQIDRAAIQRTAQQDELVNFKSASGGIRNFFYRRSGYIKNLEETHKELLKVLAENAEREKKQAEESQRQELERKQLRNPKNDPRIQDIKKSIPLEAEKERQRLYDEKLKSTAGSRKYIRGIWYETNGTKLTPITPPDRTQIEERIRQEKYHTFFEENPEQAKRYARHDTEIGEEYKKWKEKTLYEQQRREEAGALAKKRGLFKRSLHRFKPFKRNYLTLPGQTVPQNPIKVGPIARLKARLARPFIPLLNRYDTLRDWAHRTNQKYNPYEIAKRQLRRARTAFVNGLKNSGKSLGRSTWEGAKGAGRLAWRGSKTATNAGFRGAAKGIPKAGNSLSRAASRLPSSGNPLTPNIATGLLKRGPGALLAFSFGWWVAIVSVIVFIFLIFFLVKLEDEKETGQVTISLTTPDTTTQNPPPNVDEKCKGGNCVTSDVLGAKTSASEASSRQRQEVLQATDEDTGILDTIIEGVGDIAELIKKFGEGVKDSLITYEINVTYSGRATDIRVHYPIPPNAYFIAASGKYTEEKNSEGKTTAVNWSVRENQGGGGNTTATSTTPAISGTPSPSPASSPSTSPSNGNLTFDAAKFRSYGFPDPQSPNPLTLNAEALQRWKQFGMPAAVKAGNIVGIDPGIIGYWSFAEGLNYDMTLNVCGPTNAHLDINDDCGTPTNWQVGNFGAQPANAANVLKEAFDAMYGSHDDATVQRVGQSVIDAVKTRHGVTIDSPSSTFPKISVDTLMSTFGSNVSNTTWVGHLARDDQIGAYVQAKVFKGTLGPGFADSILYGYGNKQNIINHIKAIYDAGLSGTGSGGGSGGASFSPQTFKITILPKDPDTFFNSGAAEAEVIGAQGGGSSSSNPQATGDLQEILAWGQKINDALEDGNAYPGTWYNKMVKCIGIGCPGDTGASGAVDVGGTDYKATIRPGNSEADLYWCTFTIIDAYNLAGHKGLVVPTADNGWVGHLAVMDMIPFFANTSGYIYLNYNDDYNGSADKKVLTKVKPGYAFFIMNHTYSGGHTGEEHTGMVKNISVDANGNGSIETLESNSTAKSHTFTVTNWEVLNTAFPLRGFGGI